MWVSTAKILKKDSKDSKDSNTIIGQFMRGGSVKLYLRFWPTYPATQRYEASFSLIGFTRAHNDYRKCHDKSPA